MHVLKIQFLGEDGATRQEAAWPLSDDFNDSANLVGIIVSYANSILTEAQPESPEGKVVTPLPPDHLKEGKIEGIVTPKPPLQVEREQQARFKEVPDA